MPKHEKTIFLLFFNVLTRSIYGKLSALWAAIVSFGHRFLRCATGILHKAYIGQKKTMAGTDTVMIKISNGNPMRQ